MMFSCFWVVQCSSGLNPAMDGLGPCDNLCIIYYT